MSEPLKISILTRTDTDDFEQLKNLLKKFTIDTYLRNKPEFAELRGTKKFEFVNMAISEFEGNQPLAILSDNDLKELKKDINSQIDSAIELINNNKNEGVETRYYVLKDGDRMIAFQQVQLSNSQERGRIEGWRNLAYADQEYAGKNGQVIDTRGEIHNKLYSEAIYDDITKWFEENQVNYERTCTGVNMLPNIHAYIRAKGFLPFDKNDKTIFLEKFIDRKIDRGAFGKAYSLYCDHRQRTERKEKSEILEEIKSMQEFVSLSENQIKGLVQCFLKEDEKEIEIPEKKLEMLNKFIQTNLDNRKNTTDYQLLYNISGLMIREIQIENREFGEITTESSEKQTRSIALDFFRQLDSEFYKKAKNIIEGNSDIDFNMYSLKDVKDFSSEKGNDMPEYTNVPSVVSRNGKSSMYVPCKGTIEDIYLLVHEISHTFDLILNDNPTRNVLGEIAPHCFESMLSQYLVQNNIATREETINREKGNIVRHYDDSVETFAKLELMKLKEKNGTINQDDLVDMQKNYGLTNRQFGYILGRLGQSESNVDYKARYMIAQLIYPHYMEQYEQNPQNAIRTIKEYFEQIKTNNFEGSLETLGINPSIDSIQGLIETANRRIQNLEHTKMFSEEEIGKATVKVQITQKDESKKKVQTDEKILEEAQELKIQ